MPSRVTKHSFDTPPYRRHWPASQRPCVRCGRLFVPQGGGNVCSYYCPEVTYFDGEPTKPGPHAPGATPETAMSDGDINNLTRQWLGYAWKMACRYIGNPFARAHLEVTDLYAEAALGLREAACRFDPSRGVKFLTYATWWVERYIRDALAVAAPVTFGRNAPQYASKREELGRKLNAAKSAGNVDDHFDLAAPEDKQTDWFAVERLQEVMGRLDERRRHVVEERFGIGDPAEEEKTLQVISEDFKVSRERVRQLEASAMKKLRSWLGADKEDVPRCSYAYHTVVCVQTAALDGFCARHHPVARLSKLQDKMASVYDEADLTGDQARWEEFGRMEEREAALMAEVEQLRSRT